MMKKQLLTLFLSSACLLSNAQDPLWLRYSAISPDGKQIVFKYKGDLYRVASEGGEAQQLTSTPWHETSPVWSNDSKTIAYSSDKEGGFDVYTIPATGGKSTRLTTHSVAETPLKFSLDNKHVYYSATIQDPATSALNPASWIAELYKVQNIESSRSELVVAAPISSISFDRDGESFIYYNRTGSENIWRKHHTSSVSRDIFRYDAKSGDHTPIIERAGEDRDPIYSSDYSHIYFLSERNGGSFNIYKSSIADTTDIKALTKLKDHPVRFLTMSNDGVFAFSYHGEIYTMREGESPKKVDISIVDDHQQRETEELKLSGAGGFSISEDGKQIVMSSRGEIFATTDEYTTTKQITKSAIAEKGANISPDGKTILFAREIDGKWNIYKATRTREEEQNFANSTLITETALFSDNKVERCAPQFSPDGKEIAFIENRDRLMVLNVESGKVRQITDGSKHHSNGDSGFDYQWSPDGKWFALSFITNTRDPYSDIGIVSAVDGGEIYNITNSAYIDNSPKWVLDGNAIMFRSNRYGMRSHASWGSQNDVIIAFLNSESYDKFNMSKEDLELYKEAKDDSSEDKKEDKEDKDDKDGKKKKDEVKPIDIELSRLEDRIKRLTPMSSNMRDFALSKDGEKLYFLSQFEKSYDLWELETRNGGIKLLKKLNSGSGSLQLSSDGKSLYMLGGRSMKISLPGATTKDINFNITMELDRAAERAYMFEHVFTQEKERFYNKNYHGVNLDKLHKEYQPMLEHINNNYDFAELLSEILGELNVSHTGSGYRPQFTGKTTPSLGLLFDLNYNNDGLKIDEVLRDGPFDSSRSRVSASNIIEKIDGIEVKAGVDYYPLINGKQGKNTLISLYDPTSGERWDEVIKPISQGQQSKLLYKRWIRSRSEEVERLSGGRLGYVHIEKMGDDSYREIYSDVLGRFNKKEGVVIDTRNNGGGRLHEDVEVLFSGEKYLEQVIRGEISCDMPSRRYNKPSIMLVCEANYSNAHGTPWVYQNQKLGSIVGMPVPGTMTSVSWETLQDPTLYFGIPVIGYRTREGSYLENSQLEPDFKVRNDYKEVLNGRDQQLEAAVKQLLSEIDSNNNSW